MSFYSGSNFHDPRQATLLQWVADNIPLPLVGADVIGTPRAVVEQWFSSPGSEFCVEFGRLRAVWIQRQLALIADPETGNTVATRARWLLSKVDPTTFSDKAPPKTPDARHRPAARAQSAPTTAPRPIDTRQLEIPES